MNRTDRLLAIVLELGGRRYTRAEDLSALFEVGVRTIYRDVLALCEAGVPVVSTPSYGYGLAPGYFLPPLMLTPDEAGTLVLGAVFLSAHVDAPYRQAVESARKKVEQLLPERTRHEVEMLQESLRFAGRVRVIDPEVEARLTLVRRALSTCAVLHLVYQGRHGESGERDVEPHGLVWVDGTWVLASYCRVRQGVRHFRLDRVEVMTPTGERFTRRPGLTVRRITPIDYGREEVRALVASSAVHWARETRPYSFVREEQPEPDMEDGTVMVFRPRQVDELIPWLLSWGPLLRVLTPTHVQHQLAESARAVVALYHPCHSSDCTVSPARPHPDASPTPPASPRC